MDKSFHRRNPTGRLFPVEPPILRVLVAAAAGVRRWECRAVLALAADLDVRRRVTGDGARRLWALGDAGLEGAGRPKRPRCGDQNNENTRDDAETDPRVFHFDHPFLRTTDFCSDHTPD